MPKIEVFRLFDGPRRLLANQAGMSLLMVLMMLSVLGLSAAMAGNSWTNLSRRAREADLLWKGNQIRAAIGSYYSKSHGQGAAKIYPSQLDYLLKDPRFLQTTRHLRRLFADPMTGGDWALIKDPAGRIKGVRSTLAEEPFKQSGFSEENRDFEGRTLYTEWEFVYQPAAPNANAASPRTRNQPATNRPPTAFPLPAPSAPAGAQ
jgi:type II secretory pathway pseudopilin PulG